MPEPPRRKRFQIHLSTALILMIAAGGLIWANVRARHGTSSIDMFNWETAEIEGTRKQYDTILRSAINRQRNDTSNTFVGKRHGFPLIMISRINGWVVFEDGYKEQSHTDTIVNRLAIAINAAVALCILFTIWFVCEWRIRRRVASAKMRDGK